MTDALDKVWPPKLYLPVKRREEILEAADCPGEYGQHYLREDIARAVRPLEWRELVADAFWGSEYLVYATTKDTWAASLTAVGYWGDEPIAGEWRSEEAAKAAAQADYERRILSALMPVEGE